MRYAVFAYDDVINKYNEYVCNDYIECEIAMKLFTDNDIASFICVSDESLEGKIVETLLRPNACFNA